VQYHQKIFKITSERMVTKSKITVLILTVIVTETQ